MLLLILNNNSENVTSDTAIVQIRSTSTDTTWCQEWDGKCLPSTPAAFHFKQPDEWSRWKRRFDQFRLVSGLCTKDDKRQVSMLLYCMGKKAEEVLLSTNISEDDRQKYDRVISHFDGFFKVRNNVIFEIACFNRRSQKMDKTVDEFITSLYNLVENCAFDNLTEEMICDRIMVGILNQSLSEWLQLDADLTLENAKTMVRQ